MEMVLTARQYARIRRKVRTKKRNEPPRLTVGEEVFNAISHGFGAALAITGLVLLLLRSDTPLEIMASCFYGISMVVMMSMSSIYHAMPAGSGVKRLWRRFDYTSIYLLIGGTFAPILLVYYGGRLEIALFCVQWGVILLGVTLLLVFGAGALAAPAFYAVFFDRLERADVPAGDVPKQPDAAVVHPGGRRGVYAGDDPLCEEGEVQPLRMACVRPGGGGAALDRHLHADLLRSGQNSQMRPFFLNGENLLSVGSPGGYCFGSICRGFFCLRGSVRRCAPPFARAAFGRRMHLTFFCKYRMIS